MSERHTPAPWKAVVAPHGPIDIFDANGSDFVTLYGRDLATARLMAAAPDLLDALRGMVLNACSACDENYVIRCTKAEWEAHVAATNRAIAAIAKAEDAA